MQYKIVVDKQSRTNPSEEKREYTIDIEELRVKGSVYDSINIEVDKTYVTRRLSLSEYGVLTELDEPIIENLDEVNIQLFEGDNYIYLVDMTGNKFYAEYLIKNDFNDIYATRGEMNTAIEQTARSIELSVNQKLTGYSTTEQMNAAIQLSASSITSTVSKTYATKTELTTAKTEIKQTTDSITSTVSQKVGKTEISSTINQTAQGVKISAEKLDLSGLVTISNLQTAGKTTINGSNITTGTIDASKVNVTNLNASNIKSGTITGRAISGGTIKGTQITNGNNFKVDASGNMTCNNATMSNATINGGTITINGGTQSSPNFEIVGNTENVRLYPNGIWIYSGSDGGDTGIIIERQNGSTPRISVGQANNPTVIYQNYIKCQSYQNYSLESIKKNISKYDDNALKTILNSDIYKYNLKTEKDADKKHIGFVIGNNYKTPKEVINNEGNAIDLYSCIGILWKAMQELSNKVEVSK